MYDKVYIDSISELGTDFISSFEHNRYCCPYCVSRRGKEDNDYKLYVNVKRISIVGFCFKCNIVVFSRSGTPSFEKIAPIFLQYLNKIDQESSTKKIQIFDISFTESIYEDNICLNYLLNKRKIPKEMIDYWEMRSLTLVDRQYVFIPDEVISQSTNFYQLRVLDDSKPKYISATGCDKPIMKLYKHEYDELYLVEGVFSAIAIGREAVPLLGKYMSRIQVTQLRNHYERINKFPKYVYICLDGGCVEESMRIYKMIRSLFTLKSRILRMDLPLDSNNKGLDPDELREGLKNYKERAIRLI